MNERAGAAAGSKRARDGLFGTTVIRSGRTPALDEAVTERLVDDDDVARSTDREPLLEAQGAPRDRARGAREAGGKEDRHRLVEVEDDGHADRPQRQAGEDEEVRHRVDLHERVVTTAMGPADGPAGPGQEREVLAHVGPDTGALVALDVDPVEADAVDEPLGVIARPAQPVHVDRTAGRHERLGLTPDARVLLVVAVGEHRDRPTRRGHCLHGRVHGSRPPCRPAEALATRTAVPGMLVLTCGDPCTSRTLCRGSSGARPCDRASFGSSSTAIGRCCRGAKPVDKLSR